MIITGGENVYSAEVENVVARHPAVAACAVIGVPHDAVGRGSACGGGAQARARAGRGELHAHCRSSSPATSARRSVEFRDALPLSGAGKVLKRELREPHWPDKAHGVAAAVQPAR